MLELTQVQNSGELMSVSHKLIKYKNSIYLKLVFKANVGLGMIGVVNSNFRHDGLK